MSIIRPNFVIAPYIKPRLNIGALLDIPTGSYITGLRNESILNGGLAFSTGIVALGNHFKSTLMHYMTLSAASKIAEMVETSISTYDTEINMEQIRLLEFSRQFDFFKDLNIIENETWMITDKTICYANEWYEILKAYLEERKKDKKNLIVTTPFPTKDPGIGMNIVIPTFSQIDSFSEFETSDVAEIRNKNELGDSAANTLAMRQGLAKMRFLMELPILTASNYHYNLSTAGIGKDILMPVAPGRMAMPVKKLQHLKNGDKIKGVTDKYFTLLLNLWHIYNASVLINDKTKSPLYPKTPGDEREGDPDLNIINVRNLRGKSGQSGNNIDIIISQVEGVLPSLTEFHFIKDRANKLGISGTLQNYNLDLLPDVKLQRTNIRSKIDENPLLRRALNITSEMAQMHLYWRHLDDGILCTPLELYNDLKEQGYDWNDILKNTRGWWTVNNDKHPVPPLSTMDLLRMHSSRKKMYDYYVPYWLKNISEI